MEKPSNNFHDIWQGISPGLEPLPKAVQNFTPPEHSVTLESVHENTKMSPPQLPLTDLENKLVKVNEADVIADILTYENITMEFLRELYRKCPSHISRMLSKVIDAQKAVLKKVSAVYFIKTGLDIPVQKSCPYITSISHSLRNLYLDEYHHLNKYQALIDSTKDEQLRNLCIYLSETKTINTSIIEQALATLLI